MTVINTYLLPHLSTVLILILSSNRCFSSFFPDQNTAWMIYEIFIKHLQMLYAKVPLIHRVGTKRQVLETKCCIPGRNRCSWHNKQQNSQDTRTPNASLCSLMSPCLICLTHSTGGQEPASAIPTRSHTPFPMHCGED